MAIGTVNLSGIFDVEAPEIPRHEFLRPKPPIEGRARFRLSQKTNKERLIADLLIFYRKHGNLSRFFRDDRIRSKLENLLRRTADRTIENILKKGIFTFWRNGETFLVFEEVTGRFKDIIVKFARPGKEFERDASFGYSIAKDYLGPNLSVNMNLCKEIDLQVRDLQGVPRCVRLKNVLVQERVLVLGDIYDMLSEKMRESADPESKKEIAAEIKKIKRSFDALYTEFGKRNIIDTDKQRLETAEGRFAIFRNYGFRVPKWLNPIGRRADDFLSIEERWFRNALGFDFDSLKPQVLSKGITGSRVRDVFEKEIMDAQEKMLERILLESKKAA